jgi:hypothetical protein
MNFPNMFIHNRKGQVWMDEGDFNNADFKRDTTWKITQGNFANAKGAISISSAEDKKEFVSTKKCAGENG